MTAERLTPDRAVRLLRAKAHELEQYVLDVPPGDLALTTPVQITHLTADIALLATLLADEIERSARDRSIARHPNSGQS